MYNYQIYLPTIDTIVTGMVPPGSPVAEETTSGASLRFFITPSISSGRNSWDWTWCCSTACVQTSTGLSSWVPIGFGLQSQWMEPFSTRSSRSSFLVTWWHDESCARRSYGRHLDMIHNVPASNLSLGFQFLAFWAHFHLEGKSKVFRVSSTL